MTQFTTLTEQTARDLIDLLRRDRAHPRGGPARVGNIGQQGQVPVRWGKTSVTPDYPTYPSSGNVVGVSLGNYEPSPLYPGATAVKTFTAYSPPIYVFATVESGSIPAVGTEVRLTWRNGFWWITASSGPRKRANMVSHNNANGWRESAGAYAAVSSGTSLIVGYNGTDTKDVKFWPSLAGCSTNDEGTAFTWVNAPSAYSDNWLTLKQTGYVKISVTLTVRMNTCDATDRDAYLLQDSHYHTSSAGGLIPGNTGVTTAQGLRLETLLLSSASLTITTNDGTAASSVMTHMPVTYVATGEGTVGICHAIALCYRGASDEYVNISVASTFTGGQLYVKPVALTACVEQVGDEGQF